MNAYKVAIEVNKENIPKYLSFTKKKITEYNEINNNILPVPATYIINNNKKISYAHYDPDYSNRANFVEILNSVK